MDDDMECETDVEEPICEGSDDDLGLEISDEEERLVYIYSVIVIIYNKYTKLKTEIITNNYKKVFPSRGLDPGKSNEGEVPYWIACHHLGI